MNCGLRRLVRAMVVLLLLDPGLFLPRGETAARGEEMPQWISVGFLDEPPRRSWGGPFEPFGAEDLASEGHAVHIPEPLLFDLVRPLGARQGELEINTLAVFPWRVSGTPVDDPFGSAPTSFDRRQIEWAPEIEYAVVDDFAIEFELPFEGHVLEEYKLAAQWTIGTAFDDRYIHGFQVITEPTVRWKDWNSTFLYLGGIRFDDVWSALFMAGFRMNLAGPKTRDSFEKLLNVSLFADVSDRMSLGIETNSAVHLSGSGNFIIVPQAHYEITNALQIQAGLGFGFAENSSESSAIIRVVYSR